MKIKVIISGGGTGGHIYPGIAVANAIKLVHPDADILFVGAEGKMEMEKVPKAGYSIIGLPIRGISRDNLLANINFPFRLLSSLWRAKAIINEFKPSVVVGTGGYASGALLQTAVWSGVPALIQEQNGFAGMTNRILSKKVRKICVAYEGMEAFFPKEKIVFTGNPVRTDILYSDKVKSFEFFKLDPSRKTLLVLGGSGGAKMINDVLKEQVIRLLDAGYQVIWQTGANYIEDVRKTVKPHPNLWFNDFIYEMKYAYDCADVVVARAGALTISELCLTGKPAILVPSPFVAEDHQTKNAMVLHNQNAALLVKNVEAPSLLIDTALSLLEDKALQKRLSENILLLARPQAAEHIAKEVLGLIGG